MSILFSTGRIYDVDRKWKLLTRTFFWHLSFIIHQFPKKKPKRDLLISVDILARFSHFTDDVVKEPSKIRQDTEFVIQEQHPFQGKPFSDWFLVGPLAKKDLRETRACAHCLIVFKFN